MKKEQNLLGEQLRRLRQGKGLSQEEVANLAGVSYVSYNRWENNRCLPSFDHLQVLADYYDTELNTFSSLIPKSGAEEIEPFAISDYKGILQEVMKANEEFMKSLTVFFNRTSKFYQATMKLTAARQARLTKLLTLPEAQAE